MNIRGLGGWALAIIGAVGMLATGCSSSDDAASFCGTLLGRERECGILAEGQTSCVDYYDKAEPCEIECIRKAPCAELVAFACGGDPASVLATCAARCVGLEPVTCQDGTKLSAYTRCTGFDDCGDGTDEQGCTTTGAKCRSVDQFVPFEKGCDGHKDCFDGSDENAGCAEAMKCKVNGVVTSIPKYDVCNGNPNCDDGSDEPLACAPPLACPNF